MDPSAEAGFSKGDRVVISMINWLDGPRGPSAHRYGRRTGVVVGIMSPSLLIVKLDARGSYPAETLNIAAKNLTRVLPLFDPAA